jgi:hypothetical protein
MADAGLELHGGERLDHVVVGAGVQGADDAGVVVPRGGDDHRHGRHGPEHPQQLPAVEVGQPEVQDDEVRALLHGRLQSREGGAGGAHRVAAVAQGPDDGGADPLVVLHDQELGHALIVTPPGRQFVPPSRGDEHGGRACQSLSVSLTDAAGASAA